MTTLASSYDPSSFESRLYAQWEAAGYFVPSDTGEPYTVLLPPPMSPARCTWATRFSRH